MEDIAIGDFFVEGFVIEDLIVLCVAAIGLIFLSLILSKAPRTKGIKIEAHIIYLALVVIILWLCPEFIQKSLFSHLGVVIVGTFMPIYESIKAVVSIDVLIDDDDVDDDDNNKRVDDTDWLEFWIISGMCIKLHHLLVSSDQTLEKDMVLILYYWKLKVDIMTLIIINYYVRDVYILY